MLRHLAPFAALVVFFTILFAMTTELPFWLPLGVLSFNWIAAPLIGHWFDTRNPHYDPATNRTEATNWKAFGLFIAAFAFIGWLVSWQTGLPYLTAFAYVLLALTTVAAVNAIIIDWEDNQKGGWLNP